MTNNKYPTGIIPHVDTGLQATIDTDGLRAAVTLINTANEPVHLRSMTGSLLDVELKQKDGDVLWDSHEMTTQATKSWKLPANTRHTQHFVIPNRDVASHNAEETAQRVAENWVDYDYDDVVIDDVSDIEIETYAAPANQIADIRSEVYSDIENTGVVDSDGVARWFNTGVDIEDLGIVRFNASLPEINRVSTSLSRQFDLRSGTRELDNTVYEEQHTVEQKQSSQELKIVSPPTDCPNSIAQSNDES